MKKVYKLFFIWDYEKEEKWINEMSQKGLQLKRVGFCNYWFEEIDANLTYRIELLPSGVNTPESKEYIEFLSELDIQVVAVYTNFIYIRKNGDFELFSDEESRKKYLASLRNYASRFALLSLANLLLPVLYILFLRNAAVNMILLMLGLVNFTLLLLFIYAIVRIQRKIRELNKDI